MNTVRVKGIAVMPQNMIWAKAKTSAVCAAAHTVPRQKSSLPRKTPRAMAPENQKTKFRSSKMRKAHGFATEEVIVSRHPS